MELKVLVGVLFIFMLSKFDHIKTDDTEQVVSTDLPKDDKTNSTDNLMNIEREGENGSCASCGVANFEKGIRTSIYIGDTVRPPYKYPWMVQIHLKGKYWCTGVIIDEYYILTAGHALLSNEPDASENDVHHVDQLSVHFVTSTYEVREGPKIEKIHLHPDYQRVKNDIGLIELKEKISCDKFVRPICLPEANLDLPQNTLLFVSGWGSITGKPGVYSDILKESQFRVKPFFLCPGDPPESNGEFNYCLSARNGQVPCHGDSGAPAMYHHGNKMYVVGVVSYGRSFGEERECNPGRRAYFTKVPYYVDWIHQIMSSRHIERRGSGYPEVVTLGIEHAGDGKYGERELED